MSPLLDGRVQPIPGSGPAASGHGLPPGGAAGEVVVWKAAGEGQWALISNENVSGTAAIVESKLSIPEMVKLTGEQTITGRKNFSTAESIEALTVTRATPLPAATGKAAGNLFTFTFPAGGEGTNGAGGLGGGWVLTLGAGGKSVRVGGLALAGKGGGFVLSSGVGGEAVNDATHSGIGGKGGPFEASTGAGGRAVTASSVEIQSGAGGLLQYTAGAGGEANNTGEGAAKAGPGGDIVFNAGSGGEAKATGPGIATSGDGGAVRFKGGTAGLTLGAKGKGGTVKFAGGIGATAALSGPIELLTGEAESLRLSINGEGLTTIKAGLTVEGALTLPAASIVEGFIKALAVTEPKLGEESVSAKKLLKWKVEAAIEHTSATYELTPSATRNTLVIVRAVSKSATTCEYNIKVGATTVTQIIDPSITGTLDISVTVPVPAGEVLKVEKVAGELAKSFTQITLA